MYLGEIANWMRNWSVISLEAVSEGQQLASGASEAPFAVTYKGLSEICIP